MPQRPAEEDLNAAVLTLGIETSCDETACAVVQDRKTVLSSVVASQTALHAPFGGVVPEIASRAHTETIVSVIEKALRDAATSPEELTAVAVTTCPGLIGSLLVGLTAAKALAVAWGKPLVAVDHLHAHVMAAIMSHSLVPLPACALVVSGGHTVLLALRSVLEVTYLGGTTDDAAGEAFDKVAQLLQLGYPGGPAIASAARGRDSAAVAFPRALLGPESLNFSFSGMKTAVLYLVRGQQGRPPRGGVSTGDLAASFQEAVVETLVEKCRRALKQTGYRTLLVGGGVAANERLREKLTELAHRERYQVFLAHPALCTDNAAMVAALGGALYEADPAGTPCGLDIDADPNSSLLTGENRWTPND